MNPSWAAIIGQLAPRENRLNTSQSNWIVVLKNDGNFQTELDVCVLDFPKILGNNYNLGHNILEHYNVLIQTQLTTSKAKRDI